MTCTRRAMCEFAGTACLLAAVVGSGIMGERLSAGNTAIALMANSIATGAALLALILTLGPVSGAHLNPAVTLTAALQHRLSWSDVPAYIFAEIAGAYTGVACANVMFGLPPLFASSHIRAGWLQLFSEGLATLGLVAVIFICVEFHKEAVPVAVAAYVTAAYWFTSSTSFANPAVTLARAATDTFAGIRPHDVPGFVAAQLSGAALANLFLNWLRKPLTSFHGEIPDDSEKVITH
jgi:glycerol uptake facilitator-like aquaporin